MVRTLTPMSSGEFSNGASTISISKAYSLYLRHISDQYALCAKHELTTAIHTKGKVLQVYRQYDRDEKTAKQIREVTDALPSWEALPYWKISASHLQKVEREVSMRMRKHSKQHPIVTKGVEFEGRPILIHAYKFEPDPIMKLELIIPELKLESIQPELPLQRVASAIRCHEFIVPTFITLPKAPYAGHETEFLTVSEYLRKTMPKNTYATQYLAPHFAGDG